MQVFNRAYCSAEFNKAFDVIMAGGIARLPHWPEGQFVALAPSTKNRIAVYRDHKLSAPFWIASSDEQDSTAWVTEGGMNHA